MGCESREVQTSTASRRVKVKNNPEPSPQTVATADCANNDTAFYCLQIIGEHHYFHNIQSSIATELNMLPSLLG